MPLSAMKMMKERVEDLPSEVSEAFSDSKDVKMNEKGVLEGSVPNNIDSISV